MSSGYAIQFAATILTARELNDSGSTPCALRVAITDAIEKANRILEKIDRRWPTDSAANSTAE